MARSYQELVSDLNFTFYPAPERKFQDRILVSHFFGGNQKYLLKHIRLLNQIGFDVYAFDFSYKKTWIYKKIPSFKNENYKLQKIWMTELEEAFSYVPKPCFLYGFSGPAACSVKLAAKKENHSLVKGIITDSGPFTHLLKCNFNLAKVEFGVDRTISRLLFSLLLSPLWNWNHTEDLLNDLSNCKEGLPYLSIQPLQDEVVPVAVMKDVFTRSKHKLQLTEFEVAEGGHLTSLKLAPSMYKTQIKTWLESFSVAFL